MLNRIPLIVPYIERIVTTLPIHEENAIPSTSRTGLRGVTRVPLRSVKKAVFTNEKKVELLLYIPRSCQHLLFHPFFSSFSSSSSSFFLSFFFFTKSLPSFPFRLSYRIAHYFRSLQINLILINLDCLDTILNERGEEPIEEE